MIRLENITGFRKTLFLLRVRLEVFFFFLSKLNETRIGVRRFIMLLRRLLFFLTKMEHNKFVKIGRNIRIDLYVPGFPSKAFYTACRKFMVFDRMLPCTTVLISVTSACRYRCKHCYQKYDKGTDLDIDLLVDTVKKLQDMGICFFNIEGGEPFLVYDRLKRVCQAIDNRSEIWINSTGDGITPERLDELKRLNVTAIMFSLHSPEPEIFNSFMGRDSAWDTMNNAVQLCHEAGIAVAFNSCLQKEDFYNGRFGKLMDKIKELKAAIVQIIKPKPAGGWLESGAETFAEEDIIHIKKLVGKYNQEPEYEDYPSISAQIIEEDKDVFGCTAGGVDRFYLNAKGDIQPCEFLNISFGNIVEEDFETIYERMRRCFDPACNCALCEKYSGEILQLYKQSNQKLLPLPVDLSKKVYSCWERGERTEMYSRIDELK